MSEHKNKYKSKCDYKQGGFANVDERDFSEEFRRLYESPSSSTYSPSHQNPSYQQNRDANRQQNLPPNNFSPTFQPSFPQSSSSQQSGTQLLSAQQIQQQMQQLQQVLYKHPNQPFSNQSSYHSNQHNFPNSSFQPSSLPFSQNNHFPQPTSISNTNFSLTNPPTTIIKPPSNPPPDTSTLTTMVKDCMHRLSDANKHVCPESISAALAQHYKYASFCIYLLISIYVLIFFV